LGCVTGLVQDRTIDYDADNRPVLVAANGNATSYLYGPDGSRLKKVVGSSVTLYLGNAIERDPSGAFTNYVCADVKRAAGVLRFLHRDHLASVRRVTDAAGTLYLLPSTSRSAPNSKLSPTRSPRPSPRASSAGFSNNGAVVGPDDGVDADGVAERRAHFAKLISPHFSLMEP
jgi:hypothetical protein